jgi:hypothetical protein
VQFLGVGEAFAQVGDVFGGRAPAVLASVEAHEQGGAPGQRGDQRAGCELANAEWFALTLQAQRGMDV